MAEVDCPVLQKQKEEFLANISTKARATMSMVMTPFVEFQKIEIICPGRPDGNIEVVLSQVEGTLD